jgi:hypothetical protein
MQVVEVELLEIVEVPARAIAAILFGGRRRRDEPGPGESHDRRRPCRRPTRFAALAAIANLLGPGGTIADLTALLGALNTLLGLLGGLGL